MTLTLVDTDHSVLSKFNHYSVTKMKGSKLGWFFFVCVIPIANVYRLHYNTNNMKPD